MLGFTNMKTYKNIIFINLIKAKITDIIFDLFKYVMELNGMEN